jgi:acetyltransferase-like isoleucine patch superfamily enzyme
MLNSALIKRYNVQTGDNFCVNGVVWLENKGSLFIGHDFRGNSGINHNPIGGDTKLRLIVLEGATLKIGNNCRFSNSTLIARISITVGDHVFIGGGCRIWDNDFHSIQSHYRESPNDPDIRSTPITIGDHVFIGASSIILKGVSIGDHAVVGAGSVVTRDIPARQVWAGNPARFVTEIPESLVGATS